MTLYCLPFFDVHLLIFPLTSSNFLSQSNDIYRYAWELWLWDKNIQELLEQIDITRPLCARIDDKRDLFFPDHFQDTSTIIPDQITSISHFFVLNKVMTYFPSYLQFHYDIAQIVMTIWQFLTAHSSGAPAFTPYISGVHVAQFVAFCVRFVDHCLSFLSWPLYFLSFLDLHLLITIWHLHTFFHININIDMCESCNLWQAQTMVISKHWHNETIVCYDLWQVWYRKMYIEEGQTIQCQRLKVMTYFPSYLQCH